MAKFKVIATNQFKKDLKTAKKRGAALEELFEVVNQLADGKELPIQMQNHLTSRGLQRLLGMSHQSRLASDLFQR